MTDLNSLPNFEMSVGELNDEENVTTTSLVTNPATDMMIQVFSKTDVTAPKVVKLAQMPSTDQYERVISGVWMMPDTKYYRVYNDFEFTVSFTKQELKKALINYLKNNNADSFDYQHDGNKLNDLISIEHWIIESKDTRSPVMGYSLADLGYLSEEIPNGTVMKSVYIKDEQFFNDMVLSGNVMGYSIEGLFNLTETSDMIAEQFSNHNMFKSLGLEQNYGIIITNDGNLSFNKNVIELNGVKVLDGEYKTTLGFNIVIKKGLVVDFGFEDATDKVTGDSVPAVVVEQVAEVAPAVIEPVIEAEVAPVVVDVVEVAPVAPDTAITDTKDTIIADQLAELNALKDKLAAETKIKEDLMKAKPIAPKQVVTAPSNLENYIVREKGGVTHYIPKR